MIALYNYQEIEERASKLAVSTKDNELGKQD